MRTVPLPIWTVHLPIWTVPLSIRTVHLSTRRVPEPTVRFGGSELIPASSPMATVGGRKIEAKRDRLLLRVLFAHEGTSGCMQTLNGSACIQSHNVMWKAMATACSLMHSWTQQQQQTPLQKICPADHHADVEAIVIDDQSHQGLLSFLQRLTLSRVKSIRKPLRISGW